MPAIPCPEFACGLPLPLASIAAGWVVASQRPASARTPSRARHAYRLPRPGSASPAGPPGACLGTFRLGGPDAGIDPPAFCAFFGRRFFGFGSEVEALKNRGLAAAPMIFARYRLVRPVRIGREIVTELLIREPTDAELVEFALVAPRFAPRIKRTGVYAAAIARLCSIPLSTARRLSIGDKRALTSICTDAIRAAWRDTLALEA